MALWGHRTGVGALKGAEAWESLIPSSGSGAASRELGTRPTRVSEHRWARGSASGDRLHLTHFTTASSKPCDFPPIIDGETEARRGAAPHPSLSTEPGYRRSSDPATSRPGRPPEPRCQRVPSRARPSVRVKSVCASCGCLNKLPPSRWLTTRRPTVLEIRTQGVSRAGPSEDSR